MEEPNMLQPKDEPITIEFDALIEDPLKLPKSEQIKEEEDPNYKLVCVESSRLLETQDPQNGKSVSHHVQDESTIDHKDVLRNSIISQLMMQVKDEPPSSEFEATMEDQEIKVKIEQPIETIDDLSSNFPDTVSTESLDVPSLESIQAHDDTGAGSSTIIDSMQQQRRPKGGLGSFSAVFDGDLEKKREYEIHMKEHLEGGHIFGEIVNPEETSRRCMRSFSRQNSTLSRICDGRSEFFGRCNMYVMKRELLCDVCGKSFFHKGKLIKHIKHHQQVELLSWEGAGKHSNRRRVLNRRRIVHYNKNIFSCSLCESGHMSKQALRRHMMSHPDKKPYSCGACGKRYRDRCRLNEHFRMSHTDERPFQCDTCDFRFGTRSHWKRHVKGHKNRETKGDLCKICGKHFVGQMGLKRHMILHSGEKPFSCQICGRRFSQKSPLTRHMYVHLEKKPFSCDHCGRGFIRKSLLETHLKRRTEDHVCRKRYDRKSFVSETRKVKSDNKPVICDMCSSIFTSKKMLRLHIESHVVESVVHHHDHPHHHDHQEHHDHYHPPDSHEHLTE